MGNISQLLKNDFCVVLTITGTPGMLIFIHVLTKLKGKLADRPFGKLINDSNISVPEYINKRTKSP